MNLASGDERRSSPRVPFLGQAVVRAAGRHVPCTTVNLSATGMMLLPAASARAGLSMRVVFEVDRYLGPVEVAAVLAREGEHEGTYGWGVRFTNVPSRVSSLLQQYIQHRVQADREQVATPPLGVDNEPNDRGHYLQVKRRGPARQPASVAPAFERPVAPGSPTIRGHASPSPSPSSGAYRRVGAGSQEVIRTQEFSMRGLSAPTGEGSPAPGRAPQAYGRSSARSTGSSAGRYAQAGSRHTSPGGLDQTGPPRRGALSAVQTGPHRAVRAKKPEKSKSGSDAGRRSNPTPLEVRELYQAALDEIDGKRPKAKKKRSSVPEAPKDPNRRR